MRIAPLLFVFSLVAWFTAQSATAVIVTLNTSGLSSFNTTAFDGSGSSATETVGPVSVPYSYTSSSVDGGASSVSEYTLTDRGFEVTFDHARVSTAHSFGDSHGSIRFSVDEDVAYVAWGSYTAVDPAPPDPRTVVLDVQLIDTMTATNVFGSRQISFSTPNERFTLGQSGGDGFNLNVGSLSGTLVAGRTYDLQWSVYVWNHSAESASTFGTTASGYLKLSLPPPAPAVPVAGLVMLGLALPAAAAVYRVFARRRIRPTP